MQELDRESTKRSDTVYSRGYYHSRHSHLLSRTQYPFRNLSYVIFFIALQVWSFVVTWELCAKRTPPFPPCLVTCICIHSWSLGILSAPCNKSNITPGKIIIIINNPVIQSYLALCQINYIITYSSLIQLTFWKVTLQRHIKIFIVEKNPRGCRI